MRYRLIRAIGIGAVLLVVSVVMVHVSGGAETGASGLQSATAPRTAWGEPDLQGIWSVELLVPLERPAGVTTEFYTDEQVAELDTERADKSVFGNHLRAEPGSGRGGRDLFD